jgi:hypothetical protein
VHGNFRDSIGTGTVVGASQDCFRAEGCYRVLDALVFGGNYYAGCAGGFAQAFHDVLDHWATGDLGQRLAGKSNRSVTRRNHHQNVFRLG